MKVTGLPEDIINKHQNNNEGNMSPKTHKRLSIEELKVIVEPVARKYGVDRVYLFGSVARGDNTEESDYDFYIEAEKIRSISTISGFFQDLREAVGYDIDLISTKRMDPKFLNTIMREGVTIYG
jgi:hypothetical protein